MHQIAYCLLAIGDLLSVTLEAMAESPQNQLCPAARAEPNFEVLFTSSVRNTWESFVIFYWCMWTTWAGGKPLKNVDEA
jgi:hypothetical protein